MGNIARPQQPRVSSVQHKNSPVQNKKSPVQNVKFLSTKTKISGTKASCAAKTKKTKKTKKTLAVQALVQEQALEVGKHVRAPAHHDVCQAFSNVSI